MVSRPVRCFLMSSVGIQLLKKASISHKLRISPGFVAEMLWEDRKDTKGEQRLFRLSGDLYSLQARTIK